MRLWLWLLIGIPAAAQRLWNVTVPSSPEAPFYYLAFELDPSGQAQPAKLYSWSPADGRRTIFAAPDGWPVSAYSLYPDGIGIGLETAAPPPATGRRYFYLDRVTGQSKTATYLPLFSENGRYEATPTGVVDRSTGQMRRTQAQVMPGNDGSGLWRDLRTLYRVEPDGTQHLLNVPMRNARLGGMDRMADRVVICDGTCYVLSTVTGQRFSPPANSWAVALALAPDGAWFLTPMNDQTLALCPTGAGECRTVSRFSDLTSPHSLSADLSSAWVQGPDMTFSRLDLMTGEREVRLDCSPGRKIDAPAARGSLVRLAMGFQPEKVLRLDGRPVPFFKFASDGLTYPPAIQIPWEETEPMLELVPSATRCPFPAAPVRIMVAEFYPSAFPLGPQLRTAGYSEAAYHADWTPVTKDAPARPREPLHLFVTGLGPVGCAVSTGEAAPLDRLCRVTRPINWFWRTSLHPGTGEFVEPAAVTFAGLAPGLVGVYQIDTRAPDVGLAAGGFAFASFTMAPSDEGFLGIMLEP